VTSDVAELEYKCTDFYDPTSELSIAWDDPEIGIDWPISDPLLSSKDADAPRLSDVTSQLPEYQG
jgi:dTDP-4-dehydrorhamnose 3,5-epimerase